MWMVQMAVGVNSGQYSLEASTEGGHCGLERMVSSGGLMCIDSQQSAPARAGGETAQHQY
jgi:hypothetical protein